MPKKSYKVDLWLTISTVSLVAIGLLSIYSASMGLVFTGMIASPLFFFTKQIVGLALGIIAAYLVFKANPAFLRVLAFPVYILSVGLLILVFMPGVGIQAEGSFRWIEIGGFSLQASEVAKLGLILVTAAFLSDRDPHKMKFKEFFLLLVMFGLIALLVIREPDLGSTIIITTIFLSQLFLSGAPIWTVIVILGLFVLGVLFEGFTRVGYWRERISAWLDPFKDTQGRSYQMIQSLIAFSSGGFFGQGLFHGQQKFGRLPQPQTDFVFAIIGEELGFLGALVVITLYAIFVFSAIKIAARTKNRFNYLVVLGIALHIGLQGFLNMAVAVGLLPVTGVPLPFISAGGTSLIVNLVEVGILLGIDRVSGQESS